MDAVSEFMDAWASWQPSTKCDIFYRLYHDQKGEPLRYSMQDEPGNWIDISCAEYHRASFTVKIKDGKLIPWQMPGISKIIPGSSGTLCHTNDVTIVRTQGQGKYWRLSDD